MVPEPVGRLLHEQEEAVVQDQVHSLDALVFSGASVGVLEVKVPARVDDNTDTSCDYCRLTFYTFRTLDLHGAK